MSGRGLRRSHDHGAQMRWQEIFTGAEKALLNYKEGESP